MRIDKFAVAWYFVELVGDLRQGIVGAGIRSFKVSLTTGIRAKVVRDTLLYATT